MNDWKPGDVAMVKGAREATGVRALWTGSQWATENRLYLSPWRVDARPLVVIDPEDAEQVERLLASYLSAYDGCDTSPQPGELQCMRAALREFANPTPRIEEPTGRYAVVEDDTALEWVRADSVGSYPWKCLTLDRWADFSDINVVRVLSPGVEDPS